MKLLRQGEQHVIGAGKAELDGGFTETHTSLALAGEDLLDLIGAEVACLGNDVADRSVNHGGFFRAFDRRSALHEVFGG